MIPIWISVMSEIKFTSVPDIFPGGLKKFG